MAETSTKTNEQNATQANSDVQVDLQKSLNDSLQGMDEILKAKKADDDYEEKMKDPKEREKMKKLMKKYEDNEGGEDDEGEEDEDEEPTKGKGKFKKSIENVVEENEVIYDAVPILKSLTNIISDIADKVDELQKSIDEGNKIQKSTAEVVVAESNLLKSFSEELDKISKTPLPRKGVVSQSQIMNKSFSNEQGTQPKLDIARTKNLFFKSFQEGRASFGEIAKWEQSSCSMQALSPNLLNILEDHLSKGGK